MLNSWEIWNTWISGYIPFTKLRQENMENLNRPKIKGDIESVIIILLKTINKKSHN